MVILFPLAHLAIDFTFFAEYLENLHNKSSSETNPSTKIDDPLDPLQFEFNSTCSELGQAAGESKFYYDLFQFMIYKFPHRLIS